MSTPPHPPPWPQRQQQQPEPGWHLDKNIPAWSIPTLALALVGNIIWMTGEYTKLEARVGVLERDDARHTNELLTLRSAISPFDARLASIDARLVLMHDLLRERRRADLQE